MLRSRDQLETILFDELGLPVAQADAEERPLHRRRGPRGAGRRAPAAGADPRVPRDRQAQGHLRRRAPALRQPEDRAHPHALRPGRRGHRAPLVERSEPAEHPHPHRARAARSARRSSRRRGSVLVSAPTTRRSSCASSRTCRRIRCSSRRSAPARTSTRAPRWSSSASTAATSPPTCAGRARRSTSASSTAWATTRSGAPARHPARPGRGALHRGVLRALRGRRALHGTRPWRRRSSGEAVRTMLGRRRFLPEPALGQPRACASRPSASPRTRPSRAPPPTSSSSPWCASAEPAGRRARAWSSRCTTSSSSRCPRIGPRRPRAVKEAMESAMQLDVPLVVDVGSGKNWAAAH